MALAARAPARAAARFAQRRLFSSGGKVLGEEEKAAENVYIKKMEHEKLEKLARKGPNPGEPASSAPGVAANHVKTGGGPTESTSAGVSTDKHRNYAVLAGTVAALSGLGWYFLSKPKKSEEIVD
ncbi:uncharacterized protein At2g27730, mitochondrial [Oryza brachyantha]|uniref:uncharacterized protein At2g27730, mitochondrial n=1 Tax=Oryza brachyantha TaxID=4533 RepID=UPI0003EACD3C|nr:uncharacterized protein At2g27730, mitochondrial [Oryza brachyantha]